MTEGTGKKAIQTLKERMGEDYTEWHRQRSSVGGKNSHGGGFKDVSRARQAGRKGAAMKKWIAAGYAREDFDDRKIDEVVNWRI